MKKKVPLVLTGVLVMGIITGCSTQAKPAHTSYIGMENARAAALAAVGVTADGADSVSTELSERDGIAYYEVAFTVDGQEYSYAIDAMTGVIIDADSKKPDAQVKNDGTVTDYDTAQSGAAEKKDTADSNITANPFSAESNTPNTPNPPQTSKVPENGTAGEVTLEQAKQTALAHAGRKASEVTFTKAQKEFDDGQWTYEIEFVVQSKNGCQEYDYDISVSGGKILSHDYDAESYTPKPQTSAAKTENEVRKIALAKVPGAKAEHCSLWLDEDDGRLVYEGQIVYDQMEYEFEIDAYSGTVLEWEAESIYD